MTKSVIAALVLGKQDINPGQVPGLFEFTFVKDGVPGTPISTAESSVTVDLEPGKYQASARRLNEDGTEFSPATALSDVFEVAAPLEQADVPTSVTLSLAPAA